MHQGLFLVLLFPVAWPFIARLIWGRSLDLREIALGALLVTVLTTGVWYAGIGFKTHDIEIWNGRVLGKEREIVSCSHSYQCMCTTDSKGNQTCQTCYEHSHDYDWIVRSDAGNFEISRIDRQGAWEPPRFTRVQLNEPVARAHSFTNYVKAVPESILQKKGLKEQFASLIPAYPDNIYDYHHVDRVFGMGVVVPDLPAWNIALAQTLRDLGPERQANIIVVFAKTSDQQYSYALEEAWIGGKKNDIVVVVGVTAYPKIDWVRIVSWTDKEIFKVQLRDDLLALENVDRAKFLEIIHRHTMQTFARKSMKEFEYLKYQIDPPSWVIAFAILIAVGGSLGITYYLRSRQQRFFSSRY